MADLWSGRYGCLWHLAIAKQIVSGSVTLVRPIDEENDLVLAKGLSRQRWAYAIVYATDHATAIEIPPSSL